MLLPSVDTVAVGCEELAPRDDMADQAGVPAYGLWLITCGYSGQAQMVLFYSCNVAAVMMNGAYSPGNTNAPNPADVNIPPVTWASRARRPT